MKLLLKRTYLFGLMGQLTQNKGTASVASFCVFILCFLPLSHIFTFVGKHIDSQKKLKNDIENLHEFHSDDPSS